MRAWMAVSLLLVPLLAGCAGAPDDVEKEPADPDKPKSSVSLRDRTDPDDATGDLEGRVRDEVNYSLEGAHISLLGTGLFTRSKEGGSFAFGDLAPGDYTLRVDVEGFNSTELDVAIQAGKSTVATVVMLPKVARAGGFQPHIHDHWRGQDTYVVMDAPVPVMQHERYRQTNLYSQAFILTFYGGLLALNQTFPFSIPPRDDGPSIILPGTKEIEVQFDWETTDATNDRLGLDYKPPDGDWISLPAKAPGNTWRIPVEPEQTDSGHQAWTFWEFRFHEGSDVSPHLHPGEVHVKMTLHKGDLFFEQPHRDFWQDNTSLVLLDIQERKSSSTTVRDSATAMSFELPSGVLVPPGTDRIRIDMEWAHADAPGAVEKDIRLAWRTAEQDPHATHPDEYKRVEPVESSAGSAVYEYDLSREEPDREYQTSSNWLFKMTFPEDEYVMFYGREAWDVSLRVEAFRDA